MNKPYFQIRSVNIIYCLHFKYLNMKRCQLLWYLKYEYFVMPNNNCTDLS